MKKYIFGAVLSFGLLVSPAFTQASGLTTVQINAILSLLSSFGAEQSVINNVQASLTGGAPTTGGQSFCHNFNSDLKFGDQNGEVAGLLGALIREKLALPGDGGGGAMGQSAGNIVRNFDETIAAGVVQFQAKYGIRQTGYVGPITRAKLNSLYGCSKPVPPSSQTFSASPTYGGAPLPVLFTVEGLANSWTDPQTGLTRMIVDQSERYIDFGDGSVRQEIVCPNTPAMTCMTNVTHTYQKSGTYTATLFESGMAGVANIAQVTIIAMGGPTQAPVISGVSGPTSLQVGQQGTWTVKASDPANGILTYSVVWGDETNQMGTGSMSGVPAFAQTQQTATFTHTYSTAGNYQPAFIVTNNPDVRGGSAQTSTSVNVGGTIQACTTKPKFVLMEQLSDAQDQIVRLLRVRRSPRLSQLLHRTAERHGQKERRK